MIRIRQFGFETDWLIVWLFVLIGCLSEMILTEYLPGFSVMSTRSVSNIFPVSRNQVTWPAGIIVTVCIYGSIINIRFCLFICLSCGCGLLWSAPLFLYLSHLWVWIAMIPTSVPLSVSPVGVDCFHLHLCLFICLTCGCGLLWSLPLSLYLSHLWVWIAMISTSVPLSVSPVGVDCCGLCSQSPPLSLYPYGSKSDPSQLQVDL